MEKTNKGADGVVGILTGATVGVADATAGGGLLGLGAAVGGGPLGLGGFAPVMMLNWLPVSALPGLGMAPSLKISNPGTPGGLVDFNLTLSDFNLGLSDSTKLTGFEVKTTGLDVGLLVTEANGFADGFLVIGKAVVVGEEGMNAAVSPL